MRPNLIGNFASRTIVIAALTNLTILPTAQADALSESTLITEPHVPDDTMRVSQDNLRFEPVTMVTDLFRKDVVFLMRHGPTDWTQFDRRGVAPTDCAHQRLMTEDGKRAMRHLGALLAESEIIPGEIRFSQWCRDVETFDALMSGFRSVDPVVAEQIASVEDPGLNLLLSLTGAKSVTPIVDMIEDWQARGSVGPLLLITHYTNIEELTEFRVYEGEMLVLDPKLDNRVLGYLRLESAGPDIVHFK
jgi:phosphohistidine phosphatase SixA